MYISVWYILNTILIIKSTMSSTKNKVRIILTIAVIFGCAYYIQKSSLVLSKPVLSTSAHLNIAKADAPYDPCANGGCGGK